VKAAFHCRLVNDLFEDPGLYVSLRFERRALLFDLGQIDALTPREILALTDVFVTHTHIDHFIGFDRLVRVSLARPKTLRLYGPPGFNAQVVHKLAAYTWNLVENYSAHLTLISTEIHPDQTLHTLTLSCQTGGLSIKPDEVLCGCSATGPIHHP